MCDSLLVSFSPLFLEYSLHSSLSVLYNRRRDADLLRRKCWVSANGVVARAELVDGGELEDISHAYVAQPWYSEEVARCEHVFAACDGRYDVALWLGADEGECIWGRGG